MYLVKTPRILQTLMPGYTWKMPVSTAKTIYLTFDDGPIPEVTPWVLEELQKYNAKATFFCVGQNIVDNPEIFQQVIDAGHTVGNHTFNHLDGWQSDNLKYFHNARHCARLVKNDLFRPPYGHITPSQKAFMERHYQIVMWDVLSGDFDPELAPDQCLLNVLNHAKNGSIVVLHDSLKAEERLRYVLPRILEHYAEKGFTFGAIQAKQEMATAAAC